MGEGRIWAPHLEPIKPTAERRRGHARKVHPKGCHEYSMKYLMAQPDGVLVQAVVGDGAVEHSWVELPEGLAYCGVDAALYRTEEYRDAVCVDEQTERRYTLAEACHEVVRVGWYGYFASWPDGSINEPSVA